MNLSNLYSFSSNDKILIDANILLFVFCPLSTNENKIDVYSDILQALNDSNSKLYLCSTVVSEFINRWLRLDFNKNVQDDNNSKNFKQDYRGSSRYKTVIKQILNQIKKLNENYNINKVQDDFENFDIEESYKEKENDFNDLLIAHISNKYALKVLSDDRDFEELNVELVR
ncbi:MAG: hypothetical protein U9N02_01340 [Campylobacterota bacterium]|nr:hypothetical protein [Campylobacterota bacterium]